MITALIIAAVVVLWSTGKIAKLAVKVAVVAALVLFVYPEAKKVDWDAKYKQAKHEVGKAANIIRN